MGRCRAWGAADSRGRPAGGPPVSPALPALPSQGPERPGPPPPPRNRRVPPGLAPLPTRFPARTSPSRAWLGLARRRLHGDAAGAGAAGAAAPLEAGRGGRLVPPGSAGLPAGLRRREEPHLVCGAAGAAPAVGPGGLQGALEVRRPLWGGERPVEVGDGSSRGAAVLLRCGPRPPSPRCGHPPELRPFAPEGETPRTEPGVTHVFGHELLLHLKHLPVQISYVCVMYL